MQNFNGQYDCLLLWKDMCTVWCACRLLLPQEPGGVVPVSLNRWSPGALEPWSRVHRAPCTVLWVHWVMQPAMGVVHSRVDYTWHTAPPLLGISSPREGLLGLSLPREGLGITLLRYFVKEGLLAKRWTPRHSIICLYDSCWSLLMCYDLFLSFQTLILERRGNSSILRSERRMKCKGLTKLTSHIR